MSNTAPCAAGVGRLHLKQPPQARTRYAQETAHRARDHRPRRGQPLAGGPYQPQILWLWWAGAGTPDLDMLLRSYVRRFDLEHTLRFLKRSLGWTTPRLRHPEQADRSTWLVTTVYMQLRLTRPWVVDRRLPCELPRIRGNSH